MRHFIIAKYNERVTDRAAIARGAEALFQGVLSIPGVRAVKVIQGIRTSANRYDLAIEIDMDPSSLPAYNESKAHREWKETYGAYLESKAIFDCEDDA